MTNEEETPGYVIRLEGKIDALSVKLDGRFDTLVAKIESGDRESKQLFELQKSEVGHLAEQVKANSQRIASVATESAHRDDVLEAQIEHLSTVLADFTTVRKIVYGTVALILIAVVTALLALVVLKP